MAGAAREGSERRAGSHGAGRAPDRVTGLDALIDELPRWTLVGGKGGVGKTTCASALALRSASRGHRTLLVATDPARTLSDALGHQLGPQPAPVPGRENLHACQLDAPTARVAFLA